MTNHSLPRRLGELTSYLARTQDVFADWQLARREPLTKLYPEDDADVVAAAARALVPFAGDFSGGVLALDLSQGEVERAPVIAFDSEGDISVLGESFDDFLALLASDEADAMEDCWHADPQLKAWIREVGVQPHRSATNRLVQLAEPTRRFWIDWAASLRAATGRLHPQEVVDHELGLGERIGDVILGMSRDALDERWGTPEIPSWGHSADGVNAFYSRLPLVVRLDPSQRRVTRVTLYKGWHRARTADGADPMFMPSTEAMTWLASRGLAANRFTEALKASMILAPTFESFVATKIGWPVLAVIPCRDYVYLLAEKDARLLTAEMGAQARNEYRNSGYPITLEVLRISTAGIESVGRFPEDGEAPLS